MKKLVLVLAGLLLCSFMFSCSSPKIAELPSPTPSTIPSPTPLSETEKVEKQKELDELLKLCKFSITEDDMLGTKFYSQKNSVDMFRKSSFCLYIVEQKDRKPYLVIHINYYGDDWLFIENYLIKADDELFSITPDNEVVSEVANNGKVIETFDKEVDDNLMEMIEKLAKAKRIKLRYEGKSKNKEIDLSVAEIFNALKVYKLMLEIGR
jgi:hypothetical protein